MDYISSIVESTNADVRTCNRLRMAGVRVRVQPYQLINDARAMLQFGTEATVHAEASKSPAYRAQVAGQSAFVAPSANANLEERLTNLEAQVSKLVDALSK